MRVLAPALQQSSCKLKCTNLRLSKSSSFQVFAGDSLVHSFKGHSEGAHTDAGKIVRSTPYNVIVREEHWWALVAVLGPGTEVTILGHQEIKNDLLIGSPIARVGKHENSFDLNLGEVACSRVLVFFIGQLAEWSRVLVVLDDISRCDAAKSLVSAFTCFVARGNLHILEAVTLSDDAALLALTADDENSLVLLSHLPHGCMPTDELARGHLQL